MEDVCAYTYRCVLGALAEGSWERAAVREGEHEVVAAVERRGGDVEVPELEVAVRVAEAEVDGEVVAESIGGFGWWVADVQGGEDGGVNPGVEVVGAEGKPQDEGGEDDHRRDHAQAPPVACRRRHFFA